MTSSEAINVAVSGEGQKGHSNRVGESPPFLTFFFFSFVFGYRLEIDFFFFVVVSGC